MRYPLSHPSSMIIFSSVIFLIKVRPHKLCSPFRLYFASSSATVYRMLLHMELCIITYNLTFFFFFRYVFKIIVLNIELFLYTISVLNYRPLLTITQELL